MEGTSMCTLPPWLAWKSCYSVVIVVFVVMPSFKNFLVNQKSF